MSQFCPNCKSMLTFQNGVKVCKKCMNDSKITKKPKTKKLEDLLVNFEDERNGSKRRYELIFVESLSQLKRLGKNPNNYVKCKCEPYENIPSRTAYISLRFFMNDGNYIPRSKEAYVLNVPCDTKCGPLCPFYLLENMNSVIEKIDKYKTNLKKILAHLSKERSEG